tara:strand:- start:60 stop:602 length:543 start_codon:yes stop_codon:yes gene_type:complete
MKKTKPLLTLVFILIGLTSFGQTDFKWDVKAESLDKNKSELYSQSKLFISETWNSAKDVIQNDDKDAGIILIKGLSIQNLYYQMNDHKWTFSYTIKFLMKDDRCRVIIENIYCSAARTGQYEWPKMPVSDIYPSKKGLRITGVNEKRYLKVMTSLKQDLQSIVDSYIDYVKKPLVDDSDW